MLGVSYKNVAFSIMFKLLDNRGSSFTSERITQVQIFIDYFGKYYNDSLMTNKEFIEYNG